MRSSIVDTLIHAATVATAMKKTAGVGDWLPSLDGVEESLSSGWNRAKEVAGSAAKALGDLTEQGTIAAINALPDERDYRAMKLQAKWKDTVRRQRSNPPGFFEKLNTVSDFSRDFKGLLGSNYDKLPWGSKALANVASYGPVAYPLPYAGGSLLLSYLLDRAKEEGRREQEENSRRLSS